MSTPYHAQYWATALTLIGPGGTLESLSRSIANTRVDLNPHQVDAALFAIRSPFSKGVILADEVGLGKTIEAGIVITQRWAERKRRILLILPATLRKQWQQELIEKFSIPSIILEGKTYNDVVRSGSASPLEPVHSRLSGDEKYDTVQLLLSVENPANPTEIVIHVNMLKEGWDVTNLYTIVPLRAGNSRTLVEQSIGRGLRLPYGKRTGVPSIDRLTIVSHDRFQEIVDYANSPDSIIKTGVKIGLDIPLCQGKVVVVVSKASAKITGESVAGSVAPKQEALFATSKEQEIAKAVLAVLPDFERLRRSTGLRQPGVQQRIVDKVSKLVAPAQLVIEGTADSIDVAAIVAKTVEMHIELSIDISRILVVPTGEVTSGYRDFNMDVRGINLQPVAQDIFVQLLRDQSQHRLVSGGGTMPEARLEDYLVSGFFDFNDVSYDEKAELIYKLAGQVVARLQSYLRDEADVLNVLQSGQKTLVALIHAQMQEHYEESATGYDVIVNKGFTALKQCHFHADASESIRNFRTPVDQKVLNRGMLFEGFTKCLYPVQKFDTDSERRFASVLEHDKEVLKWFKPAKGQFQIHYRSDENYEPDFVVETAARKYLCEPKRANGMNDADVLAKARAAALWCERASKDSDKPWFYLLIPHDVISENKTLLGLAAGHTIQTV